MNVYAVCWVVMTVLFWWQQWLMRQLRRELNELRARERSRW